MNISRATKVSEAHGGYCADCDQTWMLANCPYWHWSKSVAMHRAGTGHKVVLFRIR